MLQCHESSKSMSGIQTAQFVTFDVAFQNRDQDGDPSKHPWAKPGSVNTFNVYMLYGEFTLIHGHRSVYFCICLYRGTTPFGIDSMPDLRKKRPIPLVSELVSTSIISIIFSVRVEGKNSRSKDIPNRSVEQSQNCVNETEKPTLCIKTIYCILF